jgi:hypothetical protein
VKLDRRTAIFAAAGVLGLVVFALVPGKEPSAQVRALEADPMARYAPPGGRLVDTDTQNEGTVLGKPVAARYARMFELPAGVAERRLRQARTAATAAGWVPLPASRAFPNVMVADKRTPAGRLQLAVTVFLDSRLLPDDVEPPALLVSLRHLGP